MSSFLTDQPVYNVVEGDDFPQIHIEIEGVDLALFASIQLHVRRPGGTKFVRDAVIDDGPNGKFHFEWEQGDLIAGRHEADVIFTDLAGLESAYPQKQPILIEARSRV
jgi:hypothetical protein